MLKMILACLIFSLIGCSPVDYEAEFKANCEQNLKLYLAFTEKGFHYGMRFALDTYKDASSIEEWKEKLREYDIAVEQLKQEIRQMSEQAQAERWIR